MKKWFTLPTAQARAAEELKLAELELLGAHRRLESAEAYLAMQQRRVARLRAFLASPSTAGQQALSSGAESPLPPLGAGLANVGQEVALQGAGRRLAPLMQFGRGQAKS